MSSGTLERQMPPAMKLERGATIVLDDDFVQVPDWVDDLASFRKWADTEAFPEKYPRICYLAGEIWIDMSGEQIFTHNQIKNEFSYALTGLIKSQRMGRFFPDGVMLTNVAADLSCKPDGTYVSNESFKTERVRLVEGSQEGYVELEGSPDMVLEVVSESSVRKDYESLRKLYHVAAIQEFWLVDVRGELQFDIFRCSKKGYTAVRKSKGWVKSHVFGKSFQLTLETDDLGNPEYSLLVK